MGSSFEGSGFYYLTPGERMMLAQYLKRLTFEQVYMQRGCGTVEEEKENTYRILAMLDKVQDELAGEGYAPR